MSSSSSSNLASLTKSHHAIAAKKRTRSRQIDQVVFDDDARRDFLTGFHKRKLAKQTAARQRAQERDKQAHLEARREQRRALREQAAANAAQVEHAYGGLQDDSSDEQHNHWNGISHGNQDAEYEGEAVVATVTVVDDFDPTELTHGPSPSTSKSQTLGDPSHGAASSSAATRSSRSGKRQPQSTPTDRSKHTAQTATSPSNPKKIKYETNAARKSQRMKQRARRTEKAERAGGKASRKRATNNTRGKKRR
ncbi:hypothetical protein ONZ45_g14243 [Pleurotus djamor]|nr:hypothetical protein ONZ45_g14243 [Pleurotus djamor]